MIPRLWQNVVPLKGTRHWNAASFADFARLPTISQGPWDLGKASLWFEVHGQRYAKSFENSVQGIRP